MRPRPAAPCRLSPLCLQACVCFAPPRLTPTPSPPPRRGTSSPPPRAAAVDAAAARPPCLRRRAWNTHSMRREGPLLSRSLPSLSLLSLSSSPLPRGGGPSPALARSLIPALSVSLSLSLSSLSHLSLSLSLSLTHSLSLALSLSLARSLSLSFSAAVSGYVQLMPAAAPGSLPRGRRARHGGHAQAMEGRIGRREAVFEIISSILISTSQSPPGLAGGTPDGCGLGRGAAGPRGATSAARGYSESLART